MAATSENEVRRPPQLSNPYTFSMRRSAPSAAANLETVADAGLVDQVARLCGVRLELLAELPHEDPQVLRVLDVGRPPDVSEQLTVRHDLASVLHERHEQLVL